MPTWETVGNHIFGHLLKYEIQLLRYDLVDLSRFLTTFGKRMIDTEIVIPPTWLNARVDG